MGINTKSFDNASDMITFSRASGAYGLTKVSYGSELVTNGTFDTGTEGWTAGSANLLVNAQRLEVENSGASQGYAYQSFSTDIGKAYEAKFDVSKVPGEGNPIVRLGISTGSASYHSIAYSSDASVSFTFVATNTTTFWTLYSGSSTSGFSALFDNISVKEVTYNSSDPSATLKLIYHPNDVPRIEYNTDGTAKGLLIEEARTNLLTYSEDFSNSEWVKLPSNGLSSETVTGPFEGTLAYRFTSVDHNHFLEDRNVTVTAGTTYTFSFWGKDAGGAGVPKYTIRDVSNSANIVSADWPDVSTTEFRQQVITFTTPAGCTTVTVSVASYSGVQVDFYVWGAQLEEGSFPTSYIKTENATATRALDTPQINVSNFINKSAGTFLATFNYSDPTNVDANYVLGGIANMRIFYNNGGTSDWQSYDGSAATTFGAVDSGEDYKLAVAIKTDSNISTAKNGDIVATSTSGTALMTNIEASPTLSIGGGSASQKLNGHIKSITYYPRRLTDAQIQRLTQPISTPTLSLTFDGQATSFTEDSIHG